VDRVWEVVRRLMNYYEARWRPNEPDPFKALIRAILSQNTNFKNEMEAFRRLEAGLGVDPKALSQASEEEIAKYIRVAGLHRQKSKKIREIARIVMEKYGGDLSKVLSLPFEEARRELMSLPGVGAKTADVVLLFSAGRPVVPVDRHIFRIARRLGLVPRNASYEEVRSAIEGDVPPKYREDAHVLLIQFGRDYCRARKPRCEECIIGDLCPKIGVKKS